MNIKRYVLALALSVLVSPASAETPPKVESFTLANGFETVVIPNPRTPIVTHMLWLRVGAADDPPGKSGLRRRCASNPSFRRIGELLRRS